MIAGINLATHPSINATIHQLSRQLRREQKMIKSHSLVSQPSLTLVVPECPEGPLRLQFPESVGPTVSKQPSKGLPTLWLDQRVLVQRPSWIDILCGRNNVEVTGQDNRKVTCDQFCSMGNQSFKPAELVIELRPRLRIAVRKVMQAINIPFTAASM